MNLKNDSVRDRSRDAVREIRRYIEDGIAKGMLNLGDKLPNERVLAEQFSAGRNTVRKILIALEQEGKISRHVGRGTFVTIGSEAKKQKDVSETNSHQDVGALSLKVLQSANPMDLMELRLSIEPKIAEVSALRAAALEIDRMQDAVDRSRVVRSLQEFEDCDDELHKAIADASRNPLFVAIAKIISAARTAGEWGMLKERTLTNDARLKHTGEHVRIVQAIRQRDPAAARREMELHLLGVREAMNKGVQDSKQ
jgi:DNA-binding FadR family transcriptional regulator